MLKYSVTSDIPMSPLDHLLEHVVPSSHDSPFRIGVDGRLILDRTINSIYVQTDKLGKARDSIVNAGKLVPQR